LRIYTRLFRQINVERIRFGRVVKLHGYSNLLNFP
jgi:hypothetical protein